MSNPKDTEYFERVADMGLKHAQVAAFGMTRRKGIAAEDDVGMRALRDARSPVVTLVGKSWNLHVTEVLRVDEQENLAMIRDSVAFLKAEGRRVIFDAEHFFDGIRHNAEFALMTIQAAAEAGAEIVVLCDTNGGRGPGHDGGRHPLGLRESPRLPNDSPQGAGRIFRMRCAPDTRFEVEFPGERRPARLIAAPLVDPKGMRMRG